METFKITFLQEGLLFLVNFVLLGVALIQKDTNTPFYYSHWESLNSTW